MSLRDRLNQLKSTLSGTQNVAESSNFLKENDLLTVHTEQLKAIVKAVGKRQKAFEAFLEAERGLETVLEEYAKQAGTLLPHSQLSHALREASRLDRHMNDTFARLEERTESYLGSTFDVFLQDASKNSATIKKNYEKDLREFDSAISKLKLLRANKKATPEKIKEAENEVTTTRDVYEKSEKEAVAAMKLTNTKCEIQTLRNVLQYWEAQQSFLKENVDYFDVLQSKMDRFKKYLYDIENPVDEEKTRVFKIPIGELAKRENRRVPRLIVSCTDFITKHMVDMQGVFRLSAIKDDLDDIKMRMDRGHPPDFSNSLDNPHVVTGILKQYLREMPDPLFTFDLYDEFIKAARISDHDTQAKELKRLVDKLPLTNKKTLQHITKMCQAISSRSEENKMTESNLAIVLCPNCLYSKTPGDPMNMVQEMELANYVFGRVIVNYPTLFPPEEDDLAQDAYVVPGVPADAPATPTKAASASAPATPMVKPTSQTADSGSEKKKVVRKKLRKDSRSMSTSGDVMRPKISLPLERVGAASAESTPAGSPGSAPHTPQMSKKASAILGTLDTAEAKKKKSKKLSSSDLLKSPTSAGAAAASSSTDASPVSKKPSSPRGPRKHESTKSLVSPRSIKVSGDAGVDAVRNPDSPRVVDNIPERPEPEPEAEPVPAAEVKPVPAEPAQPESATPVTAPDVAPTAAPAPATTPEPVPTVAVTAADETPVQKPSVDTPTTTTEAPKQPAAGSSVIDKLNLLIKTATEDPVVSPSPSVPTSARSAESSDYSSSESDPTLDPIFESGEEEETETALSTARDETAPSTARDETAPSTARDETSSTEPLPAETRSATPPSEPETAPPPEPKPEPEPERRLSSAALAAPTQAPSTPEASKPTAGAESTPESRGTLAGMKPPTPIAIDFTRKSSGWNFGPVVSAIETSSSSSKSAPTKPDKPAAPELDPLELTKKAMQPMSELHLLAEASVPVTVISHLIRHLVYLSYAPSFGPSQLETLNTSLREIAGQSKALAASISSYMDSFPNETINIQTSLMGIQTELREVVLAVKDIVQDPTNVSAKMQLGSTSQAFVSKISELFECCYNGIRENLNVAVSEAIQRVASGLGLILRGAIAKTLSDDFAQLEESFQSEASEFVRLVELRSCLLGSADSQALEQELDRAVHTVKSFLEKGAAINVDPDDDSAASEMRFLARDLVAALRGVEALLKQDSLDFGYDDNLLRRKLASATKVLREWEISARLDSPSSFSGRVREHVVTLYDNIMNFISRPDYWPPAEMMRAVDAISRASTKVLICVREMKLESDDGASPEAMHIKAYASGALAALNRIRICGALASLEMNEDVVRLLVGSLARLFNVFHSLLL
eukprot:TRINITY_DN3558_c0_g1_i1.p1 TRINITY_DN3558_c0_g1~~TRINITY_DN3558_c0_g1_i1.p1  ORF type:complete len:1362 (+),score=342.93 TRINITY_DN3558_c0_g1_i1:171-4256(+)